MNKKSGIIDFNNGNIFYNIIKGKSDFTLIFIHGAGSNSQVFEKQLSNMSVMHTVVSLDLPGHGKSKYNGVLTIEIYRDAVLEVINYLSLENIIIIGHSMAGGILFETYQEIKSKILGLVFLSAGAILPVNQTIFDFIKKDFDVFCKMAMQFSCSPNAEQDLSELIRDGLVSAGCETVYTDFEICHNFDYTENLKDIDIPILLLANQKDKMVSTKIVEEMHKSVENSKYKVYNLMGHFPHYENSKEVNQDISKFIKSLPPCK